MMKIQIKGTAMEGHAPTTITELCNLVLEQCRNFVAGKEPSFLAFFLYLHTMKLVGINHQITTYILSVYIYRCTSWSDIGKPDAHD